MSTDGVDGRLALILSEAVRGMDEQSRVVDEFRQRAAALLGAAAIVAGFLGEAALTDENGGWLGPTGVACFAGLALVLVLVVLWPRTFTHVLSPTKLIAQCITNDDDPSAPAWTLAQMQWSIAEELEGYYDDNQDKLKWYGRALAVACALLAGEVIAWLLEIGG